MKIYDEKLSSVWIAPLDKHGYSSFASIRDIFTLLFTLYNHIIVFFSFILLFFCTEQTSIFTTRTVWLSTKLFLSRPLSAKHLLALEEGMCFICLCKTREKFQVLMKTDNTHTNTLTHTHTNKHTHIRISWWWHLLLLVIKITQPDGVWVT